MADFPGIPTRHRRPDAPPDDLSTISGKVRVLTTHGHRWSPLGIGIGLSVTFALCAGVLHLVLGGGTGIRDLTTALLSASRSSTELQAEVTELRKLRETEIAERDKLSKHLISHDRQIEDLATFLARINGRAPHLTWPSPREGTYWLPVEATPAAVTGYRTDTRWTQLTEE
jgi:hypothetical protein